MTTAVRRELVKMKPLQSITLLKGNKTSDLSEEIGQLK